MIQETKQVKHCDNKSKRGFTLTEIAIVLGIIGIILGAIWVAASAVYNNIRISHANTQVLQLAQGIRSLYSTATLTTGMTVDNLICAKAAPSDMITLACGGPGTLGDAFPGGTTLVFPTSDGFGFEISMSGVSRANCDSLLVQIAGSNRDAGLYLARGANVMPGSGGATGSPSGLPLPTAINPTLADGAFGSFFGGCGAVGATVATQVVTFGFSLR
jgi:prepilin-type N-terminal cleavage/methylation domain-containing protein